jgi:Tfp pilus assembly protein PilW
MKPRPLLPPSTGNPKRPRHSAEAGFTLSEFMVAIGVSTSILIALVLGAVALQRSYAATDQYATAQNSELRVMDYLMRDLRRAQTVSVTPDNKQVSVTVPDYYDKYDANGNPSTLPTVNSQPLDPTINATTGAVTFGTNPPTITYYVDTTTQSLIRQVNWTASGVAKTSRLAIADGVQLFQLGFSTSGNVATATITFLPVFEKNTQVMARAGTTLNASVTLRDAPL